jgi:hypothetical protein
MFAQLTEYRERLRKVRAELISIEKAMRKLGEVEASDAKDDKRPEHTPDECLRAVAAGVEQIAGILIRVIDSLPTG